VITPGSNVVHLADSFQGLPDAHAIVKYSSTKTKVPNTVQCCAHYSSAQCTVWSALSTSALSNHGELRAAQIADGTCKSRILTTSSMNATRWQGLYRMVNKNCRLTKMLAIALTGSEGGEQDMEKEAHDENGDDQEQEEQEKTTTTMRCSWTLTRTRSRCKPTSLPTRSF
jgi:hypothetical protein